MKPGRELDLLVAQKVMGYHACSMLCEEYNHTKAVNYKQTLTTDPPPQYSTDISAAWEVVEKMKGDNYVITLNNFEVRASNWYCQFSEKGQRYICAEAELAPHAICLAALKAIGVEV